MTVEQRKKQLAARGGILGVSALIGAAILMVACSGLTSNPDAGEGNTGTVSEVPTGSGTVEEQESVPPPSIDEAVLHMVEVEVGTTEIAKESYFSEYSGQEFIVPNPLTADQLAVIGASYNITVVCDNIEGEVTVKVVDKTAPVIAGAKDKNVIVDGSVSYRTGVAVTDNSGEEIALNIDSSAVNLSKVGVYSVIYSATDSSGNTTSVEIKVNVTKKPVIDEDYVRPMVEKIVNQVITDDMSQWDKAFALYKWIHRNVKYIGTDGDRTSIWTGAYEALHDGRGDCFTFYAIYAALLDVAEIPNMQVARVGGKSNHWWNLVNVGDGWYHCDSSPRRTADANWWCFMQTDAQVEAYTESYPEHPNYYTFDPTLYPERGTETVYNGDKHDGNKINP